MHRTNTQDGITVTNDGPAPIVLRVSDMVAFDGCKRHWWWDKNYDLELFKPYYMVGTGVHVGLAAYYRLERNCDAPQYAIEDWVAETRRTWDEKYLGTWQDAGADELVDQIHRMVGQYTLFDTESPLWGDVLHDLAGPIVERRMMVEILDAYGQPMQDGAGNPVYLSGQCDVALGRPNGAYIVDHKTFGARTMADHPEVGLDVDDQLTAYAYLWWRTYGDVPAGVIYNVLIKETPVAPKLIKNKTALSQDKSQTTTADLFRAALRAYGFSFTPYLDFLAYLERQGTDRFFQRWTSSRNIHELRAFERRIAFKARDIVRLVQSPDDWAYASGSSYRCGRCPFIAPCKAADDGGDPQAILEAYKEKVLWQID